MFNIKRFSMGRSVSHCVALIPARGGSKRLPRKNVLDFRGKPMMAHTIQAARESGLFDQVVVSTEDEEIISIAEQYDVVVDKRPNELASDTATVVDVCLDYLNRHPASILVVLYATAPLRTADDIRCVVDLLSDQCHFAMAATLCDRPVHQTLKFNEGHVAPLFPEWVNRRADELDQYVVDNGSTYAVHSESFLRQKTFYGEGLKAYLMPLARSTDIDTWGDYHYALYHAEKESI